MKKVLLLSCSTGQGHNSCAKAIKEYFLLQGVTCELWDVLDFVSVRLAAFISWGHSFIYRYLPGLFQWGYTYCEKKPSILADGSFVYNFLASRTEKLRQYIVEEEYDTVICTHQIAAIMLDNIQKTSAIAVSGAFVATDYTCYPGLYACYLEKNFIASQVQIEAFVQCGLPPNQLIVSGIPVHPEIFQHREKAAAKGQLGINENSIHLLIMFGSMGCGPMKKILRHIVEKLPEQAEVSVICGSNQRLYRSLKRQYGTDRRIHIVGYTDKISLYMDAADLYLTKPGGISVTEAAVKNLPMVFINTVAGCEEHNMDFFLKMGAAVTADTPKQVAAKSIDLLHSPAKRQEMAEGLRRYSQPNGAAHIYQVLQQE
jgi:processive 1,2-diacylglycerol beta-glucosyltransferase